MSKNSSKVSNENKQGMLFLTKLAQTWILGSGFWKSNSGFRISSSKILCVPFSGKKDNFDFLAQICPQKNLGVKILKI